MGTYLNFGWDLENDNKMKSNNKKDVRVYE
jgi:hypothetical protein